jgi:CheY-like chemotaxis protein
MVDVARVLLQKMSVRAVNQAFIEVIAAAKEPSYSEGGILIVEDCEPLLFYLNSALLTLGYKSQFLAATLAEAHAVWSQHQNDISHVILNYELPDGLGFEFASCILHERPDVNIIVTSGYDIASIRESGGKTDRFLFLQKPFRLSELKDALEVDSTTRALYS